MFTTKNYIVFFIFLICLVKPVSSSFAAIDPKEKILEDSLYTLAYSGETDTVRLLNVWSFFKRNELSYDLQEKTFSFLIEISRKNNWQQNQCNYNLEKGYMYQMNGATDKARNCYAFSAGLAEKNNDTTWMIKSYYRQGYLMHGVGRNMEAIEFWKKMEPLRDDEKMKATLYMIIGAAYIDMDSFALAKDYCFKSYEIMQKDTAINQVIFPLVNLSSVFLTEKDYENAEKYSQIALDISIDKKDSTGIYVSSFSLGQVYMEMEKWDDARTLIEQCKSHYGRTNNNNYDKSNYSYMRYRVNKKTNHIKEAFEALEMAYDYRDLLFKEEGQRSLDDALEKHNSEKKQLEIEKQKLLVEKETDEKNAAEKSKSTQFYIFLVIVIILVFNAGFIYNRFLLTKRQNKIIEQQKELVEQKKNEADFQRHLVEEKQKEILDSINYAKRLQHAILAPQTEITKHFPENFLLYKPKDIVAGDFYFFESTDAFVFYAAADCTGHGVPGAMVSIVCSNALTRSIKEFNLNDPGKILDKTRELVVETFERSGQDVKDGMDISMISRNKKTGEIKWAGANNSLLLIENGLLKEIKPDKQPIGKSDHPQPFLSHVLKMTPSSLLFLLTDGFADQFGGEKGKKFKLSNLKELLLSIHEKPLTDQRKILNDTFENWKQDLEQLDDVCILGIRF